MKKKKSTIDHSTEIEFTINGKRIRKKIRSSLLLIDLLREELQLLGTKPGCLEGECGACSVLVNDAAINSCLYLAVNAHGKKITTIEGLLNGEKMDEVQEAMIQHGAVQCGFCSPGMTISIKSMQNHFRKTKQKFTQEEIKKSLEGNLCRCTGYVKIIDAATAVITEIRK